MIQQIEVRHNAVTRRDELIFRGERASLSSTEIAHLYFDAVKSHGVRRGYIRGENPEVANLLRHEDQGFLPASEVHDYEQPWPGPNISQDVGEFRLATPSDSPLIEQIICASYGDRSEAPVPRDWIEQDMFNPSDWFNVFVAEHDQEVGFGSAIHAGDIGEINWVCVRPEAQGHGQGRRLMRILLKELQTRQHAKLQLTVEADNDHAIRLYERFGFQNSGRRSINVKYGSARYVPG